MATYELGVLATIAGSMIFFLLALFYEKRNKILQKLFVMGTLWMMLLSIGISVELIEINNTDTTLDGLLGMMSSGYQVMIYVVYVFTAWQLLMLVYFGLQKILSWNKGEKIEWGDDL